ncbi:peptidase M3 [Candidatus Marinamargulisbacteria bacterium SCGC AAA071-K20]|nr:peptidase M3 [Candidatus Marinamargulisbacteria bacterium SCGC AAA071-K20]
MRKSNTNAKNFEPHQPHLISVIIKLNKITKGFAMSKKTINWDLSNLFKSITDPKIATILTKVKKDSLSFQKKYKGNIKSLSSKELATSYKDLEKMLTPFYRVSQFASLTQSTDVVNDKIKVLVNTIDEVESEVSNSILFFDLELGQLSQAKINAHIKAKELKNFAYSVKRSKETAQYNLTEKEEQLSNLKDLTGSDAFKRLYEELTSSFEFDFKVDGKKKTMTGSELRALRLHKDPKVRRDAMKLFYSRYEDNKLVLTHTYNNVIKEFNIERKLRGYKSPITVKNIGNDLDDKVIDVLHDITTESNKLVQEYYKIKKKILKLDDMTLADIYAPMSQSESKYTYDQAKTMVLDSFKRFDKDFYDMAQTMFKEKRVDVYVKKGKRGGAFCSSSTPDVNPYVLLNFLGKPRDVATLAHEFGHAIHAMLSQKQSLFNYHAILPLCETASVFCEMLVTDNLKSTLKTKKEKINLLTDKLEDIFATSHRQNMFSRFERITHEKLTDGIMSTDELCDTYKKELKLMFGNSVKIPEEYKWEWSTIPHIYESQFYVYSYNFGNLLVFALYQKYLEEGQSFIPKLKVFLSSGSIDDPKVLCDLVGADITKKAFWQKSITYIESQVNELKELCK